MPLAASCTVRPETTRTTMSWIAGAGSVLRLPARPKGRYNSLFFLEPPAGHDNTFFDFAIFSSSPRVIKKVSEGIQIIECVFGFSMEEVSDMKSLLIAICFAIVAICFAIVSVAAKH